LVDDPLVLLTLKLPVLVPTFVPVKVSSPALVPLSPARVRLAMLPVVLEPEVTLKVAELLLAL
jgi:hypothetical protein